MSEFFLRSEQSSYLRSAPAFLWGTKMTRETDPVAGLSYRDWVSAECLPRAQVKQRMTHDVATTAWNFEACVVSPPGGVWRVFVDYVVPVVILGEVGAVLLPGCFVLFMFLLSQAYGAVVCGVLFLVVTPWMVLAKHVTSAVAVYCASVVVSRAIFRRPCEWCFRSFVLDCLDVGTGSISSFLIARFLDAGHDLPLGSMLAVGLIRSASQTILPGTRNQYAQTAGPFFLFLESLLLFLFSGSLQAAIRVFLEGCLSFFQAPHFSSEVLRDCLSSFTYSISECFVLPLASSKFSKHALRCLSSAVSHASTSRIQTRYAFKRDREILVPGQKWFQGTYINRCPRVEALPRNTTSWYYARRRTGTSAWQLTRLGVSVSTHNGCLFTPQFRRPFPHTRKEGENGGPHDQVWDSDKEPSLPSCLVRALQDTYSCSIRTSTAALQGSLRAVYGTAHRNNGGFPDGMEDTAFGNVFEKSFFALVSSALTSPAYLSEPSSHALFGSLSSAFSVSFFCSLSVSFSSLVSQILLDLEISAAEVEDRRLMHLFLRTFCSTVWAGTLEAARQQLVIPPRFTIAVRRYICICHSGSFFKQRRRSIFCGYHQLHSRIFSIPKVNMLRGNQRLLLLVNVRHSRSLPLFGEVVPSFGSDENVPFGKPS
uniref:Transmembrane protein n=1 Tax=Toxoplasma gondii (strain ATCC 50861 / VEG) TaxID=432359 RepID=A0A0F7V544_TOXGV|nr:TPA: hypothetical protein BN1205_082395 [Toxoplasma gondii VEG]